MRNKIGLTGSGGGFISQALYALLGGRAGGQTLQGGTAANEDLVLEGTAHATKTTSYVILQPTAGNVGINTDAPGAVLQVGTGADFAVTRSHLIKTRFIDGHETGTAWNAGTLFLNYFSPTFGVTVGDEGTDHPLTVYGAVTITGGIRPAADGTAALTLCKANGDAVVTVDTTNSILGTVGAMSFTEMAAPGAGAANTARIYAKDNGAGKTQLMVQFATGVAQQLAIEA